MTGVQGEVLSATWFGAGSTFNGAMTALNGPVFAVSGSGFYGVTGAYVNQGSLNSGYMGFGLPEDKIGVFLRARLA